MKWLRKITALSQYDATTASYLLTYSMVQSPSWEANWFAASQEIPRISRNPKVHYRTHKCPPSVSILGQPNPVHIPTSHLLEIHPNIIHPSTPRSPQWSLYLLFPPPRPYTPYSKSRKLFRRKKLYLISRNNWMLSFYNSLSFACHLRG